MLSAQWIQTADMNFINKITEPFEEELSTASLEQCNMNFVAIGNIRI